ncbi:hypothetical protein EJ130_03485 [Micrococcus luteus]|nr:hypothetical protein [Micrococcus luteus]
MGEGQTGDGLPAPSLGEEDKCAIQALQPPLSSSNVTTHEHTGHLQTARAAMLAKTHHGAGH